LNKKLLILPTIHLLIVLAILFGGSYAVAENALSGKPVVGYDYSESGGDDTDWYQDAAIWVCPFH
jgi:hypothetical protein